MDTIVTRNKKCPCTNSTLNISKEAKNAMAIQTAVDPQYKCKSCIGCEKFREVYESFNYLYHDIPDTVYKFKEIFTNYFNTKLKFNLQFKDYLGFAAQCADTIYDNRNHHVVLNVFKQSYWIYNTNNPFGINLSFTKPNTQKSHFNFNNQESNLLVTVGKKHKAAKISLGTQLLLNQNKFEKEVDVFRYLGDPRQDENTLASVGSKDEKFIFKQVDNFKLSKFSILDGDADTSEKSLDTCGCNKILLSIQEFQNDHGKNYPFIKSPAQYFSAVYNKYKELKSFDTLARICCRALNGLSGPISADEGACQIPPDWKQGEWRKRIGNQDGITRVQALNIGIDNNPVSEELPSFLKCQEGECEFELDRCACDTILEVYEKYKIDSIEHPEIYTSFKKYFMDSIKLNVDSLYQIKEICATAYLLSSEPIGYTLPDSVPMFSTTYTTNYFKNANLANSFLLSLIEIDTNIYKIPSQLSCYDCFVGPGRPFRALLGCEDISNLIKGDSLSLQDSALAKYRLADSLRGTYYSIGGAYYQSKRDSFLSTNSNATLANAYALKRCRDGVNTIILEARSYETTLLALLNNRFDIAPYFIRFNSINEVLEYMDLHRCLCGWDDPYNPTPLPRLIKAYLQGLYGLRYKTIMDCNSNIGSSQPFTISNCLHCFKPNATLNFLQHYLDTITNNSSYRTNGVIINKLSTSWWKLHPNYPSYYNTALYDGGTSASTLRYRVIELSGSKLTMEMFDQATPVHSRKISLYFTEKSTQGNSLTIRSLFGIRAKANNTCDTIIDQFYIYASVQNRHNGYDTLLMTGVVSNWKIVSPINCCLKLCNRPINEFSVEVKNPCKERMKQIAYLNANESYGRYVDSLTFAFKRDYYAKCMRGANATEKFRVKYNERQYHYTLYYYNQAGNLVRTVPPAGVAFITDTVAMDSINARRIRNAENLIKPSYNLSTEYSYNSLNAITWQKTPDAGESNMYYDNVGRLLVSQNAKQKTQDKYSYNKYDALARLIEVGQITQTSAVSSSITLNPNSYINWLDATHTEQITNTYYDNANYDILDTIYFNPQNLRSRVAYSTYREHSTSNYNQAVHYSYDIHGNVKSLLREIPALASIGQDYKIIEYDYDLVSGKVNNVYYQRNEIDAYQHQYSYDAENRITQVQSGPNETLLDKDAAYYYYLHGPLARTELGKHQVQGVDYAYALQGWVKGVNASSNSKYRDMGNDGTSTNPYFVADEFGYSLSYYTGDYRPIGTSNFEASTVNASLNDSAPDLFNGNIRMSSIAIKQFGNTPMAYAYQYDQLNRLTSINAYQNFDSTNNKWSSSGSALQAYHNRFTYDANGNILTQVRRGSQSKLGLDSLDYEYYSNTNKLKRVYDGVSSSNYTDDIDNQTNTANYEYDEIGNLIKDKAEEIDKITWNVYGKITRIQRISSSTKPDLEFQYTPDGHRVIKVVITKGANKYKSYTYYVRDAQGNIMAIYERNFDKLIDYDSILYASVNNEIIGQTNMYNFGLFIANKHQSNTSMKNALASSITSTANNTGEKKYARNFLNCVDLSYYLLNSENLSVVNNMIEDFDNWNYLQAVTFNSLYYSTYSMAMDLDASMYWRASNSTFDDLLTTIAKNNTTLDELVKYLYDNYSTKYNNIFSTLGISRVNLTSDISALNSYASAHGRADIIYALRVADIGHMISGGAGDSTTLGGGFLEIYNTSLTTTGNDIVDDLLNINESFRNSLLSIIPEFKELFYYTGNGSLSYEQYETALIPLLSLDNLLYGLMQQDFNSLIDLTESNSGGSNTIVNWYKTNNPYEFLSATSRINSGELVTSYQTANKCLYIANCASGNTHNGMKEYFNEIGNYFGNIQRYELEDEYMSVSKYYVDTFNLNEWHIYGSSRLGVYNTNLNLVNVYFHADTSNHDFTNVNVQSTYVASPNYNLFSLERGAKRYELSNWLGNVNVVITDKRVPVCNADTVTYYTADVVSANDYSPGGAPLVGRSYTAPNTSYRFGFTGLNKDDEINGAGNVYVTEWREYDARVVTWWSIDPLTSEYPSHSPYNYTEGNPIVFTDRTGKGKESTHTDKDGKVVAVYDDGDNGVYKHDDLSNFKPETQSLAKFGKGVTKMGETLTPLSFADFDVYGATNGQTIVPGFKARIDFNSNWATDKVKGILKENPSPFTYGFNARGTKKWDIKTKSPDGATGYYFGSKLFGKYASARDAGNFAAGAIAQKSILPNTFFDYGFGTYNLSNNSVGKSLLMVGTDLMLFNISVVAGTTSVYLKSEFGENPLSKAGIDAGKAFAKGLK